MHRHTANRNLSSKRFRKFAIGIVAVVVVAGACCPAHADTVGDDAIRDAIISESLSSYPGSCPCPYNVDRAGRRCGGRSAWSRRGGYAPTCFANEISDELVRQYRRRMEAART